MKKEIYDDVRGIIKERLSEVRLPVYELDSKL